MGLNELKIIGVKKYFTSIDGEPIFHLDIPEVNLKLGTVTYLLGQNGSGKTLFLKLLSGELNPSSSKIYLQINNQKYSLKEFKVAIVRQKIEENLFLDLSVEENVLLELDAHSIEQKLFPKRRLHEKVLKILGGQVELTKKLRQVVSRLSGGQKQLLAYVIAASQKAKLLCLDEFLSFTDFSTTNLLRTETRLYAKENNACVIIVGHDFDIALQDADHILIFRNGKLTGDLTRHSERWNKQDIVQLVNYGE